MADFLDVSQVCLNGHIITAYAASQPVSRRAFCPQCGAQTIDSCPGCKNTIRGYRHIDGVFSIGGDDELDRYCEHCGKSYPWQEAAIENLKELLREGDLTEQEALEIEATLPDIMSDTPKTQSAALKAKRLLPKLGKAAYDVTIKVVSDIASETAKKTMGLP